VPPTVLGSRLSPRATCFRCDIRVTGQGHGCHALHHWFDRQGKEGGSDLLGARATIQASSRSRRTRISRVQGTGELANRFRPQSLLARRAPPARPYLTPYHSAWGTCYHVRGHEGEMIRASRLESHAAAQRFWFHSLCTHFPPGLRTCAHRARRKDASAPRGGAGRLAPTPSSSDPPPGQRAQTRKRVRWLRQAIHFVLAPAASQDG
jgi:hypothetical protein